MRLLDYTDLYSKRSLDGDSAGVGDDGSVDVDVSRAVDVDSVSCCTAVEFYCKRYTSMIHRGPAYTELIPHIQR